MKQLHFNSWPDFGCPKDVDLLLDFVQSVRSQMSSLRSSVPGPVLVHCRYYKAIDAESSVLACMLARSDELGSTTGLFEIDYAFSLLASGNCLSVYCDAE